MNGYYTNAGWSQMPLPPIRVGLNTVMYNGRPYQVSTENPAVPIGNNQGIRVNFGERVTDVDGNVVGYSADAPTVELIPDWQGAVQSAQGGGGFMESIAPLAQMAILATMGNAAFNGLFGGAGGIEFGEGTAGALADWGGAAALPMDQVGALAGGSNMSWMDMLNNSFGTGDMGGLLSDTYTNTLGDWPTLANSAGTTVSLPSNWLSNLAASDFADFGITGVESLGDALNYATGAADATYGISTATQAADFLRGLGMDTNTALNLVGSMSSAGVSPSNILKTILGGGDSGGLLGSILGTGSRLAGSYLSGSAAQDAARTAADAQIQAAKIAADAAKFKPVGVTTRFGSSNFGYDAAGNLTTAGYTLSPEMKALQDRLMGMTPGLMSQYEGAQAATAPMGDAAQRAMTLGQGYLATDPAAQAAKYMAEQQALLAPTREREYAALENRLMQQGRLGLATGATSTGMGAANPEIEALMNARRMQDLNLAAQATQGGMDYAKFGAGMVGTGGDLLKSMYGTQTAAYNPFQTALTGATGLEQLGQGAMDLGTSIGAKTSTAAANAGNLMAQGMTNAAQTMQPANAYSPWGSLLSGIGQSMGQQSYDPTRYRLTPL